MSFFTALRNFRAVVSRSSATGGWIRARGLANGSVDSAPKKKTLTVLFATQTGNSELFARQLVKEARKKQGYECKLVDLYEYNPDELAKEGLVVFVTSSFGEGEPPDNAKKFFEWLRQPHRSNLLENTRYSVFGLGALRSYGDRYQAAPKELDKLISELGAARIYERGEGNSDGGAMSDEFKTWMQGFWKTVQGSEQSTKVNSDEPVTSQYVVIQQDPATRRNVRNPAATDLKSEIGPMNPFHAPVLANAELHTSLSPRSARHIEFDISGSGISYVAGDWVSVLPRNSAARVERMSRLLHTPLDYTFTLQCRDGHKDAKTEVFGQPVQLYDVLSYMLDIAAPVSRDTLALLPSYATDATEKEHLTLLCAPTEEGKREYRQYVRNTGRSLADVLEAHPSVRLPLDQFLEAALPLQNRYYSIASSNLMHPTAIHVSVGVVHDKTPIGYHDGVSSSWLASVQPQTEKVPVYVRPSKFRLPADAHVPVIMVGAGVGLAPFRAFLQQMQYHQQQGERIHPTDLYFGCRRPDHDFIYRDELSAFAERGVLQQLYTAFSHETEKLYFVQDRMRDNGERIYRQLDNGAAVLVCGNAATIGEGTFQALQDILCKHGGRTAEDAAAHLRRMQRDGLYLQDVF